MTYIIQKWYVAVFLIIILQLMDVWILLFINNFVKLMDSALFVNIINYRSTLISIADLHFDLNVIFDQNKHAQINKWTKSLKLLSDLLIAHSIQRLTD